MSVILKRLCTHSPLAGQHRRCLSLTDMLMRSSIRTHTDYTVGFVSNRAGQICQGCSSRHCWVCWHKLSIVEPLLVLLAMGACEVLCIYACKRTAHAAADLHTIGGLPTLLGLLQDPHASIRWRAAEVVATCVQNNPPVQQVCASLPYVQAILCF